MWYSSHLGFVLCGYGFGVFWCYMTCISLPILLASIWKTTCSQLWHWAAESLSLQSSLSGFWYTRDGVVSTFRFLLSVASLKTFSLYISLHIWRDFANFLFPWVRSPFVEATFLGVKTRLDVSSSLPHTLFSPDSVSSLQLSLTEVHFISRQICIFFIKNSMI